jgi:prepilin-type N-terminal cleavage/methylation domain-containing protein
MSAAETPATSEAGFTVVEMVIVMAILGVVLGGLMTLFVQGSNAETDLNFRFQAQQQARNAIDAVRRDGHRACNVTSASTTSVSLAYWDQTLTPPACSSTATVVWCTRASGTKYALWRVAGSTCGASGGVKKADYLTNASGAIFTYTAAVGTVNGAVNQHTLAVLKIDLTVNIRSDTTQDYRLVDDVALRNTVRT